MVYLDTSFLVPVFLTEATSPRVEQLLRRQPPGEITISQLTRIELLATVARLVRMGSLTRSMALETEQEFETVTAETFALIMPSGDDFNLAADFVRRHETGLRGPDALHLAIAANQRAAAIYTLDAGMQKAGRMLGLPVRSGIRSA